MLSAVESVDLVVLLPAMARDSDYLNLIRRIKPDIIAVTVNDPYIEKKRGQAKKIDGELRVVSFTKTLSSSKLAKILGVD
jgi:bifunctional ADP-heptose synthase (sugar kinase/adenylyltransferase)